MCGPDRQDSVLTAPRSGNAWCMCADDYTIMLWPRETSPSQIWSLGGGEAYMKTHAATETELPPFSFAAKPRCEQLPAGSAFALFCYISLITTYMSVKDLARAASPARPRNPSAACPATTPQTPRSSNRSGLSVWPAPSCCPPPSCHR